MYIAPSLHHLSTFNISLSNKTFTGIQLNPWEFLARPFCISDNLFLLSILFVFCLWGGIKIIAELFQKTDIVRIIFIRIPWFTALCLSYFHLQSNGTTDQVVELMQFDKNDSYGIHIEYRVVSIFVLKIVMSLI